MHHIYAASVALLALTAVSALAQAPSIDPGTGARPGHAPGVGESLPRSNNASNIGSADSGTNIAPTLPGSDLGENAKVRQYLAQARTSLVAGRTGQAQESLEMAETRALERPNGGRLASQIHDALQALGAGNKSSAIALIDRAMAS